MDFDHYQIHSRKTAQYPNLGANFVYPTLGLVGEAGEVAEKIKKVIRDHGGVIDDVKKAEIAKELGDVLWYVSQIATELDMPLKIIAASNLEKLQSRMERGVIGGEGDNR